ncbi:hypothetical protein O0I10_002074 [Lichtheimia ornata]|uniref:Alpha/beta hydrolase fold-3 domain-containing protein n=1 Tax=Lichtheimia ornata TaxID=688661 RepID=A0AAD7VBE4_9FUNG|nr:uncharacterized protein O0I10_002074 [Lichtheimia ornata]KAJ8662380.1 hypothetical protein O0I10_002074 [Lichtheimia ornata]
MTIELEVELEPQCRQVALDAPSSDLSTLTPDEILKKKAVDSRNNTGRDVLEEEKQIPSPHGDGQTIRLVITRPVNSENEMLPVIIYLHGGGWVFGNAQTHKRVRTELTARAHAAVVFVEYTLSPKARYPTALEECFAALKWTIDHGSTMMIDASKLAVVGDSAGGNLTATVSLLAKRRGLGNAIKYCVLYYPTVDADFDRPSYQQFREHYDLTANEMKFFWNHYLPDASKRQDPLASPIHASLEELSGLPPTMVISAEADVLRDEAEDYARRLMAAHVPVVAMRYQGTIHGFATFDTMTPSGKALLNHTVAQLKEAWS